MKEEIKQEQPKNPLEEVREKFGTLLSENASSVFHKNYREKGDRILINTTSEGIRGDSGQALVDIALTPEAAKRLHETLGDSIKDWEQSQE